MRIGIRHATARTARAVVWGIAMLGWACSASYAEVELTFNGDPRATPFGAVELSGLPGIDTRELSDEVLSKILVVRVVGAVEGAPQMVGEYEGRNGDGDRSGGGTIRFRPLFPFVPGLDYRARFDPAFLPPSERQSGETLQPLELLFKMPAPDRSEPVLVQAVYPSADVWPANLLRIYVEFSTPMRERDVHRYVRLLNDDGEPIESAFVDLPEGLWDGAGKRLTLFLHPGRIKRGVGPNRAMGTVLEPGNRYRLVIDAAFKDRLGQPLAEPFDKPFLAGPDDRVSPTPLDWHLTPPGGPFDRLQVGFPEPLDRGLLVRFLSVVDEHDRPVPGTVQLGEEERSWTFLPHAPWAPGNYRLLVYSAIEDPSGNSVDHLFDQEGLLDASETTERRSLELPFAVR